MSIEAAGASEFAESMGDLFCHIDNVHIHAMSIRIEYQVMLPKKEEVRLILPETSTETSDEPKAGKALKARFCSTGKRTVSLL